jgi:hypothetical protein
VRSHGGRLDGATREKEQIVCKELEEEEGHKGIVQRVEGDK